MGKASRKAFFVRRADRLLDPDEWEYALDGIRELTSLPIVETKLDRNIKNWIKAYKLN